MGNVTNEARQGDNQPGQMVRPLTYPFYSLLRKYVSASGLLIVATLAAIIIANSALRELYFQTWQMPVSLSIGSLNLFGHEGQPMSLGAFINDFLMAIFFLSVGLEIKREVLCGELSSLEKALAPVIGACGGLILPVIFFWLICHGNETMERGVAIPMSTDIAFSLGVLSMFGRRVPVALKVFLATLAVADDLGGIVVIAFRYSEHLDTFYLMLSMGVIVLLVLGNLKAITTKMYYLSLGFLLWYLMSRSGIHATIAGVVLAFCIPSRLPIGVSYYIERVRQTVHNFPEVVVTHADKQKPAIMSATDVGLLKEIEHAGDHLISPLQDLEDSLRNPINYFIIPLFAFANAGVNLEGMTLANLFSGIGLAVIVGLVLGKFLGVLGFTWLFIRLHVIHMPKGATWSSLASVAMLCGIGFTVSMFMSHLSYSPQYPEYLADAKLGILTASLISAILGSLMLRRTLPPAS